MCLTSDKNFVLTALGGEKYKENTHGRLLLNRYCSPNACYLGIDTSFCSLRSYKEDNGATRILIQLLGLLFSP